MNFNYSYNEISREEVNLVAILYHALLIEDNITRFFKLINTHFQIIENEWEMYMEFSYLRDYWYNLKSNENRLEFIMNYLSPNIQREFSGLSNRDFNSLFISNIKKGNLDKFIISPGSWNLNQIDITIKDNREFLNICKFKWAFNAKPDLVIQTGKNQAICIEAKYESSESIYPAANSKQERDIFKRRKLELISQTALQKYMMRDILNLETQFIMISQGEKAKDIEFQNFIWKDVFGVLEINRLPKFQNKIIERVVAD